MLPHHTALTYDLIALVLILVLMLVWTATGQPGLLILVLVLMLMLMLVLMLMLPSRAGHVTVTVYHSPLPYLIVSCLPGTYLLPPPHKKKNVGFTPPPHLTDPSVLQSFSCRAVWSTP